MEENIEPIEKQDTSMDNSEALSNLIQSIQSKMNSENIQNVTEESKKEANNNNNILNNLDFVSILNAFSGNNSNQSNTQQNTSFSFDPSLMLKIQKIMSSVTKEDPKKNLLLSLKPFLRKSRQDKLNEYISMLTIANALEIFSDKGSDKNV